LSKIYLENTTNIIGKPAKSVDSKPFDDLNELSKALMGDSLPFKSTAEKNQIKSQKLNDIIKASTSSNNKSADSNENIENSGAARPDEAGQCFEALNKTFIHLESIKPAVSVAPLNLYDKNGLKVVLHFARDSPAKNIHVVVISTTNMNMQSELKNFLFQAAITKVKFGLASFCFVDRRALFVHSISCRICELNFSRHPGPNCQLIIRFCL